MQQRFGTRAEILAIEIRQAIEAWRRGDRACPVGHPICAKDALGRALRLRCPQAYEVCEPRPDVARAGL